MKRIFFLFGLLLLIEGCGLPGRKVVSFQGTYRPGGETVTEKDTGFALLGAIDVSKPKSGVELSRRLRNRYQCARLANIEVTHTDLYFVLFSIPETEVVASCFRDQGPLSEEGEGPATTP